MSAALEPVTRRRLDQFRRRQRVLQATSGIASAVVLGLALLLAVVGIDALVVLAPWVRWCLSMALYSTLAVWLGLKLRRVVHRESLPTTARSFEQHDPRLRNHLLAAVELSEDTPANQVSSPGFRASLQQQVARAVTAIRVRDLLPLRLVLRVTLAALLCLGIGIGLGYIPGLHWPHRVARALFPGANLGRISRFDIEIISPNPASTRMPAGDVAAIEARVRGPLPNSVKLETRLSGQAESIAMRGVTRLPESSSAPSMQESAPALPSASSQATARAITATAIEVDANDLVYAANLTLGETDIEYRVVADDAHTPWHRLSTRSRPQAARFDATITPPNYSGLPVANLTSGDGDLVALKGSRVRLEITADQPLRKGWLQLNLADATTPQNIEFELIEGGEAKMAFAEFPVDGDFTYRVHLEAAETGFTNAFSPEYHVKAIIDLSPKLTWVTPTTSLTVVEPNQLVPMVVRIEDELPLAELRLLTSLNGEPVVERKIDPPSAAKATSTERPDLASPDLASQSAILRDSPLRSASGVTNSTMALDIGETTAQVELDLLAANVRVGDSIRVVMQGTDRLGQSALTTPLELIVSSTAVDPQRRPATEQRIELASDLRQFSEQVQPQIKLVRDLHEQFNKAPSQETREQLQQTIDKLAEQSQGTAKELREKVANQLKLPQDSVSLAELERAGQILARIESEMAQNAMQAVDQIEAAPEDPKADVKSVERDRVNAARSAAEQLADSASVLDRRFREFVAHDVLGEIARGMNVVQDFQRQLAAQSEDVPPAQLRRRQAIVARQLRELEQIMVDRSPLLRDGAAQGMRGWIEWAGQMAERVERATAEGDDNPNFKEFTKQVLNEVNNHQNVMSVDSGLAGEMNNGRKELDARSQSASDTLARLAAAAKLAGDQQARMQKEQGQAENAQPQTSETSDSSAAMLDSLRQQIGQGLDHLQHRKELQQARGDSDPHLVNDLGNAIRASKEMAASGEQSAQQTATQLSATATALKKLEAIHNVAEAAKHLGDLVQTERWSAASIDARTESPRAWDALQQRLEQSSRAVREAGIDPKLADELDRLRWNSAAADAAQKIGSRRWSADAQTSAQGELAELQGELAATRTKLDAVAKVARGELAALAPSVPELARRAAKETDQLQKETAKLAKSAAADEVPDLKSRVEELKSEQQQTAEPINDLRDALTEMAATQDLLQENQRERARDADTSQQIIDKASSQIAQSLEPAAAAKSSTEASAPLEKAAADQGQATEALEQIADHFEKLQAGDTPVGELADSRQALNRLASDQQTQQMDEWYKTAETLGKLAGGDPQQVLKRLEDELARNVRMREELSDIAKQAVDESSKALKFSADQEQTLQSQIEQSDPGFAFEKSLLQQDIQAANERLQQWLQQMSSDANASAGRAAAREQQKQLAELHQELQQTVAKASEAREALPLEQLQRIAQQVVSDLKKSQQKFGEVAEQLKAAVDTPVHPDEQELRNRKREMEDWEKRSLQQQARGAQAVQQSHEQRHRQAENSAKNIENSLQNTERQRDEFQKQVDQQPENVSLKQQLADAQRRVSGQKREHELAVKKESELKQRLERAKQNEADFAARKMSDLNTKNPTAELASRFSRGVAETSEKIVGELEKSLSDTQWMNELTATQEQLQASIKVQDRVENAVDGVAEDLKRASRHEQRMEHPQTAERIAKQATRVEASRDREVHSAAERLATAAEQAVASAEPNRAVQAPPAASLAARQAVGEAERELRQRVQDLNAMTDQPNASEANSADQQPPLPPGATSVPLDPKMLARMLDELDRVMASDEEQSSEDPSQTAPSQSGEAGKSEDENNSKSSAQKSSPDGKKGNSQTASMQEAAQQLSQEMNRQRAQGRQSTAASRMTSNSADTKAAPPSAVRVLNVDRRTGEDWGKLREQAAADTVESARRTVAPQYRQSVETYFRVLSERGHRSDKP